jgi:hypothetical protein
MAGTKSLEVVYSRGTSFGLDVPEEAKSSVRFHFFSAPWASDSVRGGDKVESLPPSWFSQASGASESAGVGSALMGPSLGRGGCEAKNWWSYKEFEIQSINNA